MSTSMIDERGTRQILARFYGAFHVYLLRRWDSTSASITFVCMMSNLVAFALSSNLSSKYVELDSLVQPGILLSLARTEGIILLASILLVVMVPDNLERIALQSLVAGILTADAVNDITLLTTGSWLLATELAYVTAASIPAVAVMKITHKLTQPQ